MSDVTDGMRMIVARLCNHCSVLLKCQSQVQEDTKHFHLLSHWQVDINNCHR